VVKTIKIPLNLDALLNPFENIQNNTQIIQLSSSDIEEVKSQNNSPTINEENKLNISPVENENESELINQQQKLETIYEENNIEETTENNTDIKSYASSSHIEIYSNDESHVETSPKQNVSENVSNDSNIDYKNILKNLTKYKLPELQDLAIQFKLPKENNNKKKTRPELIEEIKNYISNKNI
jgi:hypothetical protein